MIRKSRSVPFNRRLDIFREASGMSLVEVLVTTLLLALVVGALVPLLAVAQQSWDQAGLHEEMTHNARFALDSLLSTMRAAQAFSTVSATDITFSYFFGDQVTIRTIEYQLNPATHELQLRRVPDAFQPFAGPFRSMAVICYDANNATTSCSSLGSFRSVQVSLVAMDPQGRVPDLTVTGRVFVQVP